MSHMRTPASPHCHHAKCAGFANACCMRAPRGLNAVYLRVHAKRVWTRTRLSLVARVTKGRVSWLIYRCVVERRAVRGLNVSGQTATLHAARGFTHTAPIHAREQCQILAPSLNERVRASRRKNAPTILRGHSENKINSERSGWFLPSR